MRLGIRLRLASLLDHYVRPRILQAWDFFPDLYQKTNPSAIHRNPNKTLQASKLDLPELLANRPAAQLVHELAPAPATHFILTDPLMPNHPTILSLSHNPEKQHAWFLRTILRLVDSTKPTRLGGKVSDAARYAAHRSCLASQSHMQIEKYGYKFGVKRTLQRACSSPVSAE